MEIKNKIKLLEKVFLSPTDISVVDEILITEEIEKDIKKNNYKSLMKLLQEVISDESIDDDIRLRVSYINLKLKMVHMSGSSYSLVEEEDDDDEDTFMYGFSEADKAKQLSAIKEFNKVSEERLALLLFNFVWDNYKKIKDGFDRTIYSNAKTEFWTKNGIVA
jgi:hypothetical protein